MQRFRAQGTGVNCRGPPRGRGQPEAIEQAESETDDIEENVDLDPAEGSDDNEQQGQEADGVGQGRYPSRYRARVEHYNPAVLEKQHRAQRQSAAVRPNPKPIWTYKAICNFM